MIVQTIDIGPGPAAFLAILALSVGSCIAIVAFHHWRASSPDQDCAAVQSAHTTPTPRIGGLGVVGGCVVALLVFAPAEKSAIWTMLALSLVPVFAAGIAEDLRFRLSPGLRLGAGAFSALLALVLLEAWVPRADMPLLDAVYAFTPFAVLFTVFAATGVVHAFNLIDGLNGLAAFTGVLIALALGTIAHASGEYLLSQTMLLLVPALAGFLLLNYPLGKIFLGDAGAYSLGHLLCWLAILLVFRAPDVAIGAILLVFFWPVADTLFSIYRRRRSGRVVDQPDRLHYHQLVMRALEIGLLGRGSRQVSNPLATAVMMPLVTAPAIAGVLLWNNPAKAYLALSAFALLYVGTYIAGLRWARWRNRTRRNWQDLSPAASAMQRSPMHRTPFMGRN